MPALAFRTVDDLRVEFEPADGNWETDSLASWVDEHLQAGKVFTKLWGRDLGPSGAFALCKVLPSLASLRVLVLGRNNIGSTGAEALSKMLPNLKNLEYLSLEGNDIGLCGVVAISKSLQNLKTLQRLYLGSNALGTAGAEAVSKVLPFLTNLEDLGLRHNNIGDQGAMFVYQGLDQAGNRSVKAVMDAPNVKDWSSYDVARTKFKPSREFKSTVARAWFLVQCVLFTGDAILDIVNVVNLWQHGQIAWAGIMLSLYLLPSVMVLFEEGKAFDWLDKIALKALWALGTATQAIPVYFMVKSFREAKERQEYVRSNARQVVYESIPQAWLQFYIFLRQQQMDCEQNTDCFLVLDTSTLLLLASFVFSILSTAWAIGSLQWAQMSRISGTDDSELNFLEGLWRQAVQVHMLHFVFEATARMMTMGILGLVLRGTWALCVLLGMFFVRMCLLCSGRQSLASKDPMWRNPKLLLVKSIQSVASAYFCDTSLRIHRMSVALTTAEAATSVGLLISSKYNLPQQLRVGVLGLAGICCFLSCVGMYIRPFGNVSEEKVSTDGKRDGQTELQDQSAAV